MTALTKFNHYNSIDKFFNDIEKYSIGLDGWLDRVSNVNHLQSNYPPYNLIKVSDFEYSLEVAVAGFKSNELTVYTENGQLVVEGNKSSNEDKEYLYRSLSHKNFKRVWSLAEEIEVKKVSFEDGLLVVKLWKIVPDKQKKKVYF